MNSDNQQSPEATKISSADWLKWDKGAAKNIQGMQMLKDHHDDLCKLPNEVIRGIERLIDSGKSIDMTYEISLELAIKLKMLPFLVASGEPEEDWFGHLNVTLGSQDQDLICLIKKLGD